MERKTYDDGDAGLVGDLDNAFKVRDVVPWVSDTLKIDGLGLVVDQWLEIFWLIPRHKLGLDAQSGEEDLELVVSAAIQVRRGDDVVACVSQCCNGHELCGLT